ncbi:tyrosine-type recombinase/integrase [Lignipirellula cremea]|uniref:Phage integrase family protein n=1 Tax=Lignipirellula cremea TaxID=2528010 RepID=A0A518DQF3_9BACT|nr:tyrosine-type recombinase/integrase [Lignipirellula cremea]QDU94044.1 Phage integrase family protein [Lignipirellula cremea]
MNYAERCKVNGVKLELTAHKARSIWKKKHKGKVYYFHQPLTKSGYEAAVLEWLQVRAKLDAERPNADVWQEHQEMFRRIAEYWEKFGLPSNERKLAKQVAEFVDFLEIGLTLPELELPIPYDYPTEFEDEFVEFDGLGGGHLLFGDHGYWLPDKWTDRIDRLKQKQYLKAPQTIEHWLQAYKTRIDKRTGKHIEPTTARDRHAKLVPFENYADLGALIATVDESFVEDFESHLDESKNRINGNPLGKTSKEGYFKAFAMFARWAAGQKDCEFQQPANLSTNERRFREPDGHGRKREKAKAELWSPLEIDTAMTKCPDRVKLYILLCLNCGFRHIDLAHLRHGDIRIEEKRIVIQRKKLNQEMTAPAVSYLLWDRTVELLEEQRADHPLLALVNRDGNQITPSNLSSWWRRYRCNFGLAGKKLASLRKTGSTIVSQFDRGLDTVYLGECLSNTAKIHYSFDDGEPCDQLDKAIQELGSRFGFCEPPAKTVTLTSEVMEKLKLAGIDVAELG